MVNEVAVYTEGKLRPQVVDVLLGLLKDTPEITDFIEWTEVLDRTIPTLVLGNLPEVLPITYVKTLSQNQILAFPAALTELKAALTRLLAPPTFPPMKYKVLQLEGTVQAALDKLGDVVVVDIETGGDIDRMLPEETWLLSVALYDGNNPVIVLPEHLLRIPSVIRRLWEFLTRKRRKLIAHNMKFDFRTLSAQTGVEIRGHLDTLLLHHVINPGAKEHGLKPLCRKYLGAPDWDAGTKEFVKGNYKERPAGYPEALWAKYHQPKMAVGFEAIPREILYEYNAYDVYWTWHLYQYLARAAQGEERIARLARFEFNMSNLFQDVERGGVAVDVEYVTQLSEEFSKEWDTVLAKLKDLTKDEKFNPNSPKQVKEFYNDIGYPLKSTAVGVLEDLSFMPGSQGSEFTDLLLEARKITKLKGTYTDGIIKRLHNGLVYPDFLVHGTSTGRLSSKDPNIQNIPRDEEGKVSLRRIFVPRDVETRSLVSVDYSQAELRVMACMSEDEYLISLFQPGMPDFFDSLMPVAFPRIDLSELDKNTKKNMRANLKGVIYGMSYGRRANAIAKALNMPPQEAQTIMNNYFRAAPALYDWRMWITEMAIDPDRTLVSPFGRYYQAELVTGRNKQNIINSGLAFLPQSTASDICVTAAIEVHKWLHEYDAYIIATIHDAILMDVPDIYKEEVAARVQLEMEAAGRKVFPQVPFATEATWGKSWEGI